MTTQTKIQEVRKALHTNGSVMYFERRWRGCAVTDQNSQTHFDLKCLVTGREYLNVHVDNIDLC